MIEDLTGANLGDADGIVGEGGEGGLIDQGHVVVGPVYSVQLQELCSEEDGKKCLI